MRIRIKWSTFFILAYVFSTIIGCLYMAYILDLNRNYAKWLDYSRLLLLLSTICGLIIFVFKQKRIKINSGNLFVVLFAIHALLVTYLKGGITIQNLMNIINWPLLYILSSLISHQKGVIAIQRYRYKIVIAIISVIMCLLSISLIQRHLAGLGRIGEVIYGVYFVLTYIPLLLFFYPRNKYLLLAPFITILFTTKRAAFLSLAIGFIAMMYFEYYIAGSLKEKWKQLLKISAVLIIAFIAMNIVITRFHLNIFDRLTNMGMDEGSGRITIWTTVFNAYKEGSLTDKIIGHGYGAVSNLHVGGRSIFAHNDYLEILYDYGIVGACFIICWIVYLINIFIKLYKRKSSFLPGYAFAMIIFIFLTMLSYLLFQSNIMIFLAIYFGIIGGSIDSQYNTYYTSTSWASMDMMILHIV